MQQDVTLSEKDVAADLGAIDPAAVPSVARSDGRPGFTEQLAGARLIDGDQLPTGAELRQRDGDQPLPTGEDDAPKIHELVVTDVLNRMDLGQKRYGQALRPHNGRDVLLDTYEELLDACAYIRQLLFERDGA